MFFDCKCIWRWAFKHNDRSTVCTLNFNSFFCLNINACLRDSFYDWNLRFEDPIDTAHQLAEKNLEWGATHDAWIFSILDATKVHHHFPLYCSLNKLNWLTLHIAYDHISPTWKNWSACFRQFHLKIWLLARQPWTFVTVLSVCRMVNRVCRNWNKMKK